MDKNSLTVVGLIVTQTIPHTNHIHSHGIYRALRSTYNKVHHPTAHYSIVQDTTVLKNSIQYLTKTSPDNILRH